MWPAPITIRRAAVGIVRRASTGRIETGVGVDQDRAVFVAIDCAREGDVIGELMADCAVG